MLQHGWKDTGLEGDSTRRTRGVAGELAFESPTKPQAVRTQPIGTPACLDLTLAS